MYRAACGRRISMCGYMSVPLLAYLSLFHRKKPMLDKDQLSDYRQISNLSLISTKASLSQRDRATRYCRIFFMFVNIAKSFSLSLCTFVDRDTEYIGGEAIRSLTVMFSVVQCLQHELNLCLFTRYPVDSNNSYAPSHYGFLLTYFLCCERLTLYRLLDASLIQPELKLYH